MFDDVKLLKMNFDHLHKQIEGKVAILKSANLMKLK